MNRSNVVFNVVLNLVLNVVRTSQWLGIISSEGSMGI